MSKGTRNAASTSGMSLGDVAHVLLKHKWKLIIITLLGWAAAVAYFVLAPPVYVSMAKLMVRYVVERSELDHVENTSTAATREGESVILSELEILTSWDLAEKVAGVPGMERLLPGKSGEPVKPGAVASIISEGINVKAVQGSNVIQVFFKNQSPEMAQKVLDELIRQYFIKHLDVHRSKEAAKFVTEKVEQSRTKLRGAEEDVTKLKADNGILSLPDAMKTLIDEQARTELDLSDTEAALAEQRARVSALEHYEREFTGKSASSVSPASRTADSVLEIRPAIPASASDLKAVESAPGSTKPTESPVSAKPSLKDISHYQSIMNSLSELKAEDVRLAEKWKPESQPMRQHRAQISKLEAERDELLKKYPEFVSSSRTTPMESNPASRMDLLAERAQFDALEAKVGNLREALDKLHKKASELTLLAPKITEKERTAALEEINYRYMGSSLEKAQIDEALDSSKIPNISIVQEATPPTLDTKKRNQITLAIAGAVPALAMGLTLLFGLILNKTVKRSQELELRMGLPLVLSIPWFSKRALKRLPLAKGDAGALKLNGEMAPWEKGHFMLPYAEAVRDRLFAFFDSEGLYSKTKLIGVSGFSPGAGTSTLAASLAAALSDIDANKVLLVDMNVAHGASHVFFGGKPADLSKIDLQSPPEEETKVVPDEEEGEENEELLVSAAATIGNGHHHSNGHGRSSLLNGSGTPGLKEFRNMMGKLKPSGYDYVVFDMPPVSAISPSAAMAGLMDHVLAVVESEATIADQVKRGYRDLVTAHATVSVVFNKVRTYGPQALAGV